MAIVLDPAFTFDDLDTRLALLGFTRDASANPVTPDAIAGERELAAWTRGVERLTYTFNPAVSLRVLAAHGLGADASVLLSEQLPALDIPAIGEMLTSTEPRDLLRGLLAARALHAGELALAVAPLQACPNATVSRAAAATLAALQSQSPASAHEQTLALMQILCRRAIPVLAKLVGPESSAALESMRPRMDDCARVFGADIAERVRGAYEVVWQTPPEIQPLAYGQMTLKVHAATAGLLRDENELSRRFPGGYRALAPYLHADRVWFVWRYIRDGHDAGVRYDGVVMIDDRWVWFPKPYLVVGEILT